ncbi:MAG TPA: TorF family putative porin [Sphingomicrobium sp.]|nr:TorF family putative porin [Sphingomicrobium sp.]
MIAHAGGGRPGRRFGVRLAFAFLLVAFSWPASAQVGATASIFTEARWRGTALSAGHPVAQLDFSYDDSSGFYGGLSASLVASSEYGIKPLALQENIGFAKRLLNGPTIDLGVINANYSRYTGYHRSTAHTEIYAGVVGKLFSSHIYLSPNYFHSGTWTAYGEVDGAVGVTRRLRVSAHVGALVPLGSGYSSRAQYDWQVAAAHEIGPVTLHLSLGDGGPGRDFYEGQWHHRRAVVAGATYLF